MNLLLALVVSSVIVFGPAAWSHHVWEAHPSNACGRSSQARNYFGVLCNGEAEGNAKSWLDHVRLMVPVECFENSRDHRNADAIPPPLATVPGPYHQAAFVRLFEELETSAWKRADLRYGERRNGGRLIYVGRDELIKQAFLAAGWTLLKPPYKPKSATLVIYDLPIVGNIFGARRIVSDFAYWLERGGILAVHPFDGDDLLPHPDMPMDSPDLIEYVMGSLRRQGGVQIKGRYLDIFQKRLRNGRRGMGRAA